MLRFSLIGTSFISDWLMEGIAHTDGAGATAAAIRAGMHVLIEKPAALDLYVFSRMRDAAAGRGRVLLEVMHPAHMKSKLS